MPPDGVAKKTMSVPLADAQESGSDALAGFVEKWRSRWPEWAIAEVFVAPGEREAALAWAALQQEVVDAAWGGSDPLPGEAKLAWWQEELQGWSAGRRRHPLGLVLQRRQAPWAELGAVLPSLSASRERARDHDEACELLRPFARAATAVDAALFDGAPARSEPDRDPSPVIAMLLGIRLAHSGVSSAPLDVVARAGAEDAARRWREQLLREWPAQTAAQRPRRLWCALARHRLQQHDPARPLPPWRTLLVAWRAARN